MKGKLLFLGTGGSMGVPVIGCGCEVCHSKNPFNKRLRPSVLVKVDHKVFLIDAGPDYRTQALQFGITALDGVLFTHAHHDHTAGVDDLKVYSFRMQRPLPSLMSLETAKDLKVRYYYIFNREPVYDKSTMRMEMHILNGERGEVEFEGIKISYLSYEQGGMQVNGYRIGSLAYLSDISRFPPSIFEDLKGVKTLILSALRFTPSPLHFTVDDAVDFSEKSGASRTFLTHISHDLDHDKTNAYLPPNIRMAYDGLEIDIEE